LAEITSLVPFSTATPDYINYPDPTCYAGQTTLQAADFFTLTTVFLAGTILPWG
jgi:hypothetical protein